MKLSKIAGLAIGGYFLFQAAKDKYDEFAVGFEDAMDSIRYDIKNIRNIDVVGGIFNSDGEIRFDMDLKIINPTEYDFSINSGELIELKKITIFNKGGQELATIDPGMTEINLEPNDHVLLKELPVSIPLSKIGMVVDTFLNNLSLDKNQFAIRLNVVVAGQEFELNNQK